MRDIVNEKNEPTEEELVKQFASGMVNAY